MTPTHEQRIFRLVVVGGLPAVVAAVWLVFDSGMGARLQWALAVVVTGSWLGTALAVRERVVRPLQTLSNMVAALREQDYSLRARGARPEDALGLALWEVNTLSVEMHDRRLGALEAGALLRRVMAEIDVAVFAFDEGNALRVVNAFGARLLGQPEERLLGRNADELGLGTCLTGSAPRIMDVPVGASGGRWELRRGAFRQDGRPHRFIVLADVSRTLREEERLAWQRLIRVLAHEINNSITPIQSLAGRLQELVRRETRGEPLRTPMPGAVRAAGVRSDAGAMPAGGPALASAELRDDLERGLGVITSRAEALTRFIATYTQLARLPVPKKRPVRVSDWVHRVARLESRIRVEVVPGPDVTIDADGDQLDQVLINLVKNAADAVQGGDGGVRVRWTIHDGTLAVVVEDDGPGVGDTANLFVPFYTTKDGGTGVGLVLSRQIAEAHGGSVTLANRMGATGCEARLVLPLS
ncbi:MAG TPA: ATP-binding protein [Gemmatimonadaceae bacterium]|nr:ATP-binding protein [Gemmatimonadaceae bacterium]